MPPLRDIERLRDILATLRTPGRGCAWDLQQTHATLAPYALEEAYEVVDAIERGDATELRDELGDYLLQVVFHARLAEEAGRFDFGDIVAAASAKMLRRHPHIFAAGEVAGAGHRPSDPEAMAARRPADWETIKAGERVSRRGTGDPERALAGIPSALPSLTRSVKLQARAATVGFDWSDARLVLAKIREEADEVEAELAARAAGGANDAALRDEIGDLLFAVANLARHVGVDPETAARAANAKFERRFAFIEDGLAARDLAPARVSLEEMEALWRDAKAAEKHNNNAG